MLQNEDIIMENVQPGAESLPGATIPPPPAVVTQQPSPMSGNMQTAQMAAFGDMAQMMQAANEAGKKDIYWLQ